MANSESSFKDEVKASAYAALFGVALWCATDKVQSGLSDLSMIWDLYYALELKFVKSLPARDSSKLLSHPFSEKQIRHLMMVHQNKGGIGLGVIGLSNSDALIVTAPEIVKYFTDGNISRAAAEDLFKDQRRQMNKEGKLWNVTKLLDENVHWKNYG